MNRRRQVIVATAALALVALGFFVARSRVRFGGGEVSVTLEPDRPAALDASTLAPSPAARGTSPDGAKATELSANSTPPADAVVVTGRVVDEARTPVAGAEVWAALSGASTSSGRSDVEGRFRVSVAGAGRSPYRLAVRAAKDGLAASRGLSPWDGRTGRFAVGDLVLRAAADLTVHVVDHGSPVASARVFASSRRPNERLLDPIGSRDAPWFGWPFESTTDSNGVATLSAVPLGDVRVLALAAGPRRGEVHLAHDARSERTLELVAARDVVVEVVEKGTGAPVVGVRVGIETTSDGRFYEDLVDEPLPTPATDATGKTTLPSLPRGQPFMLVVVGDGWIWPPWRTGLLLGPVADYIRLEVPIATANARLAATFLDGPPAPDGTVVTLEPLDDDDRGYYGQAGLPVNTARIDAGALVVEGLRNDQISALARLPDGRIARFVVDHHMGDSPPVFHRPRSVVVRVIESDGAPVADALIVVTSEPRRPPRGVRSKRQVRTGADGSVRVGELSASPTSVTLEAHTALVEESRIGVFEDELRRQLDLTIGDGEVTLTMPRWIDVRLAITDGGRTRFPPGLDVVVGMHPATLAYVDPPGATWDATSATIAFRVRRTTKGRVLKALVTAPGRATVSADFRDDDTGTKLVGRAEMGLAGSLVATVLSGGTRDLAFLLQRRGDDDAWGPVWSTRRAREDANDPRARVDNVPLGTYRLCDADYTGAVTDTVEVRSGETTTLTLDLSRAVKVDVSVELPDGTNVTKLRIHREGAGIALPDKATSAWIDGTASWSWWLPGDRPVRIWATHPDCVATPGEGDVTVADPGPKLTLKLARKPR